MACIFYIKVCVQKIGDLTNILTFIYSGESCRKKLHEILCTEREITNLFCQNSIMWVLGNLVRHFIQTFSCDLLDGCKNLCEARGKGDTWVQNHPVHYTPFTFETWNKFFVSIKGLHLVSQDSPARPY